LTSLPERAKALPFKTKRGIASHDEQINAKLVELRYDPLGYVMWVFPWTSDPTIQKVKLAEPWASRFNCEWGPDAWACEFLDELGVQVKKRKFNGRDAVDPIQFSTASGHGIGKSTLVAWLIKYILDVWPMSKGVVTANTSDQLKTKTWAQVGFWNIKSLTGYRWEYSASRGNMNLAPANASADTKEMWRCDAMTCREENSESFQGLHAASGCPFYIYDEASGIPDKIFEARSGGATDGMPMWFDFGNPTRKSGFFFENTIGKFKHRYITRSIDSRDVAITNKKLFQEWVDDWGEDSDFVKVKVRGVFPSAGSLQFINSDDVASAMKREGHHIKADPLIIGVDVARFGGDSTVLFPRIGYDAKSFPYEKHKGLDNVQVAEKVIDMVQRFAQLGKTVSGIYVDGGGLGGGVVDILRRVGYNPLDVNFGRASSDNRYRLKGDQMWGDLREALPRLQLPFSPELEQQLTQREYGFTMSNKIALESKSLMKERLGEESSPDIADALALTYAATPASSIDLTSLGMAHSPGSFDYDPLETNM